MCAIPFFSASAVSRRFPGIAGKTLHLCGDSITFANEIPYNYEDYLQANLPELASITNHGESGQTFASRQDRAGAHNQIIASYGADIISLFFLTNDWGYNVPLGNASDTTYHLSVRGAVHYYMNMITQNSPNSIVLFCMPLTRQNNQQGDIVNELATNALGLTVEDYRDAARVEIQKYKEVFILDCFDVSGLLFSQNDWNSDGLHLNNTGADRFGAYWVAKVKNQPKPTF